MLVLLAWLAPMLLFADWKGAAKWSAVLDEVTVALGTQEYQRAARLSMPLMAELRQQTGPVAMTPETVGAMVTTREGLTDLVRKLKNELQQKDLVPAVRSTFLLGVSLSGMYLQLPADERVRQTMAAADPKATGGAAVRQMSQLLFPTLEANQLDSAQRIAQQVLSARVNTPNVEIDAHKAYTVLGLIAVRQNDYPKAKSLLLQSIKTLKDGFDVQFMHPNLVLAEAVLKSGDLATVGEYLDACIQFAGFVPAKPRLRQYKEELASGKLKTFGVDGTMMF